MNPFVRRQLVLSTVSALVCARALAADPTPDPAPAVSGPPVNIFIELQIVAIPMEAAAPLVRELMDRKKIEAAYGKIQELLASGGAELIGWPMVVTQSGRREVFEAVDEIRYVTEYESGGIGVYFPDQGSADSHVPSGAGHEKKSTIAGTEFNAVPANFDTRNAGVTLAVEPTLSADARSIQLRLVPQHVRLKGMAKVTLQRPGSGEQIIVEQPEFDTKKSTQFVTVKSGERMLLGVYPTSDPGPRLEIFLLKAEARKVE